MSLGLSVILPAFNEADHLAQHLDRLSAYLAASGRAFEILVVDDGSRDSTRDVAHAAAKRDERIQVFTHDRNRGKGCALATGCAGARQPLLVFLDADLEIPPEDILPLVERLEAEGADVAVGSKYHPDAHLQWPLGRRALSRLYHLTTALLFRLPLRDTQTGLKALRREAADELVPQLRSQRFAWDLELILLAHRRGKRCVTGPVHVEPSGRASRVGWGGALQAGIDTLWIWARDCGVDAYRAPRPARAPRTRVLVSGDDLGLSASIDEGLLRGAEMGGLTSVSVLATGPRLAQASADFAARVPTGDAGLHLDLLRERGLLGYALRSCAAPTPGACVRSQLATLEAHGIAPTHVDAHRHAWCLPWVYRAACRATRTAGIRAVRGLRPLGSLRGLGLVEASKRILLRTLAVFSAGVARAHGLHAPDGWIDARAAAAWCAAGRVPRWARGRTLEIIGHPAEGPDDVPGHEQGILDRAAEADAVLRPPLARALADLDLDVIDFRALTEPPAATARSV